MNRHPSDKWSLLRCERSNEDRAIEEALAKLRALPTSELATRIEASVLRGDVVAAKQYGRAMDQRAGLIFGSRKAVSDE